jgi:hypothetical protein
MPVDSRPPAPSLREGGEVVGDANERTVEVDASVIDRLRLLADEDTLPSSSRWAWPSFAGAGI